MILRRSQRQRRNAVAKCEEAGFLAFEKFFDDNLVARRAEGTRKTGIDGGLGFFPRCRNDDAFTGRQSVGLDNDRQALRRQIRLGGFWVHEAAVGCRRNVGLAAEILGKAFRAFELCRGFRRTEILNARLAESVTQPCNERCLGADDDQLDPRVAAKLDDDIVIGRIDRDTLGDFCNPGIPGRAEELGQERACAQRPGERVLAAARANQQDIHQVACCNSRFGVASNEKQARRPNK